MVDRGASPRADIAEAIVSQARACDRLGSEVYGRILLAMLEDHGRRGVTSEILDGSSERPLHDAVVLRLLSALHRLALAGRVPEVARHFPSTGGTPGSTLERDVVAAFEEFRHDLATEMDWPVQTNETGRSAVAAAVHSWLGSAAETQVDWLELGASAGLNLNFLRYSYERETGPTGDVGSPLAIGKEWCTLPDAVDPERPRLRVARGCDLEPLDARSDSDARRLLSYVWPDQTARLDRLSRAIDIARHHPPDVDRASADVWLPRRLAEAPGSVVVFHSIVWQYLGRDVQDGVRDALATHGARTSGSSRLYWVRMEPAGAVADVRVTTWRDGRLEEHTLATVGYHGQSLDWTG